MKLRKFLFVSYLVFCMSSVWAQAATHNYYFSNSANGNPTGNDSSGNGTIGAPWASLNRAQTAINSLASTDIANLYFDRGDIWTWASAAVSTQSAKFTVSSTNPIVNIDAYGTGNKPIFDGLVTDFKTVPVHVYPGSGPFKWNRFFHIERDDCSISNVEIKGVYGHAVFLKKANDFTLSNNLIHGFGSAAIALHSSYDSTGIEVSYNTIHTGQQLFLNSKLGAAGWGGAIMIGVVGRGISENHYIHHNTIYDIAGEGVQAHNSIVEYNIVGDTCSTGLMAETHAIDAGVMKIRYNVVMFSDYATSAYTQCVWKGGGNGKPTGIRIYDDEVGGDNSGAKYEIYGNVVINRDIGFWFFSPEDKLNPFGSVKIYNNLIIDSVDANYRFYHGPQAINGMFYDNSSILYDRAATGKHVDDDTTYPDAGWTITGNHFWTTGGAPVVDSNWRNNFDITDPQLKGEELINWIQQSGSTYYMAINPATHLNPPSDSQIYGMSPILSMDINNIAKSATKSSKQPAPVGFHRMTVN